MKQGMVVGAAGLLFGGAVLLVASSDATAKKSVQMECSAFEVPSVRVGQQRRDVLKARALPEGWVVVGGGVGPSAETDTYKSGAHVLACREHVPGSEVPDEEPANQD